MKRIILSIFTALLLAACFSFGASALTEGDWEFQLLDDEVHITKYLGSGGDVVIPDKIYDRPVTSMESYTPFGNVKATLKSITFPSTMKNIPINICYDFKNLETIILPEGIEEIESWAFGNCSNLKNVSLPSTIKTLHSSSFANCISLTEIKLPNKLELVKGGYESGAFCGSGLTSIDLSNTEAKFESYAFYNCKNLKTVVLNKNTKEIPDYMFAYCSSLSNISIPNSVEVINGSAFHSCTSLKSIILPTSLKKIKDYSAFGYCTSLTEVVIPYGVTSIGGHTFEECTNMKSVYIPDTVESIGILNIIEDCPNAIIYCTKDSYTAKYCKDKQISYLTDNSVNSPITVLYNGTRISFHTYDQTPELINSRTLVPLRSVFEAMKATVEWDAETRTAIATRNGITIRVPIDSSTIYKNDEAIPIDVPAQIINSRTMVPVRVIAEAFGADVQWNGNGMTVIITENTTEETK